MKILLINSRYGYVGGPERYLFNLQALLQQNGHAVIPFSIDYSVNEPTPYHRYFASPLSESDSVYYKDQGTSISAIIKTLERNFYSREVEKKLIELIRDVKPDFAIVLLYLRKLSPAVLVALSQNKVPFFVRLSDFGMICASHNFFRENQVCEKCRGGRIINSVKYKCVHQSYAASLVNYTATKYHQIKGFFNLIPHFVCPSRLLMKKMIEEGWDENKFSHLPTLAYPLEENTNRNKSSQLLYAGRIAHIKGVHHLIEAFLILKSNQRLDASLLIAGGGDESYLNTIHQMIKDRGIEGIRFMGNVAKEELDALYSTSLASIVPSLCYDNMPNSALESLAAGTPVVAPDHGSFSEIVQHGKTGFLYTYADPHDMAQKLAQILFDESLQKYMQQHSRDLIIKNHAPAVHYQKLMKIIEKIRTEAFQMA